MNHLQIIKVRLFVGLDAKSILLLRKLKIFQNKDKSEIFDIRKGVSNCSTSMVNYLIERRSCSKQYVDSTIIPFRSRFSNYKSGARKKSKVYPKKWNVYQEQFHRYFNSEGHNGMEDWFIYLYIYMFIYISIVNRSSYVYP